MEKEDYKVTKHPSFGSICLTNVSGNQPLFMSSVDHSHFVALTICEAEHYRGLHYDRIHPGKELIRVYLSTVQLGEMLTNMNNGSGTPCTISRRMEDDGKYREQDDPPQLTKKATYLDEFKRDCKKISEELKGLYEMAKAMESKPSVTKGERKELSEKIDYLRTAIGANLPFILEMFNENVEKVTAEAKNEVEQYRQDVIERLGMKAFAANVKSKELEEPK